jgi:ribonuclease J
VFWHLLSDSTNVEKDGYTISDKQVGETLSQYCSGKPGPHYRRPFCLQHFTNSADYQYRIQNRQKSCLLTEKALKPALNLPKNWVFFTFLKNTEIDIGELDAYSEEETLIITTGSQGEPMSALARMAGGNHKYIKSRLVIR